MKLLDLFCGAGGTAMGYHRAGFEIVGVDNRPQPNYPFEFVQADAMTYPLGGFDVIHASPPCQAYIQRNKNLDTRHPKLIEPLRELLKASGVPYVIENVLPEVLNAPTMVCGTALGLKVIRHRYFETPFAMAFDLRCQHNGTVAEGDYAAVYAFGGKGLTKDGVRDPKSAVGPEWDEAMGIDWMTKKELAQAIPPAYTEYIGRRVMEVQNG